MIAFRLFIISLVAFVACSLENNEINYITTSAPIAMIIKEIVVNKAQVEYIVPANTSPHTYNAKPSDMNKIAKAKAFFFVAKNNDGWATNLKNKNTIELIRLIDTNFLLDKKMMLDASHNHNHFENHTHSPNPNDSSFNYEKYDSHFWTDPVLLQSLTTKIVDTLSKIDPKNAQYYKNNGDNFIKKLNIIDKKIRSIVANIKEKPIFLHHPSFLYFINRYGLTYGGSLEPNPGQELTPKGLSNIIDKVKKSGVKAIFSEPQLPDKVISMIANETGSAIYELDPIGANFRNYNDFILFNANKLKESLE